jgi:TRAF3-interacting protein 1
MPVPEKRGGGGTGGFSENDIEFMKKAIQILCQSTNPLGKSIDFVTDDIDSMNKEYEHWRKESVNSQAKLEEQQRITEEVLHPL